MENVIYCFYVPEYLNIFLNKARFGSPGWQIHSCVKVQSINIGVRFKI